MKVEALLTPKAVYAFETTSEEVIDKLHYDPASVATVVATTRDRHKVFAEVVQPTGGPTVHEADEIVVRHMPFGNSAASLNQRLQTKAIAGMLQQPVIAVSAPSATAEYNFKAGDDPTRPFEGYANTATEALRALDIPLGRLAFVGWSQGATIGLAHAAEAAKDYDVSWVAAGEPTNVTKRSRLKLMKDMSEAGFPELFDTLASTGLLSEFMAAYGVKATKELNTTQLKKQFVRQVSRNTLHEWKVGLKEKMRILKHLGGATLQYALPPLVVSGAGVALARAADSPMCPEKALQAQVDAALQKYSEHKKQIKVLRLLGANHTQGDHPQTMAFLARQAALLAR